MVQMELVIYEPPLKTPIMRLAVVNKHFDTCCDLVRYLHRNDSMAGLFVHLARDSCVLRRFDEWSCWSVASFMKIMTWHI